MPSYDKHVLMIYFFPQMTQSAYKDYSRSREYLSDMASREGVAVFEDVTESLESVVKSLRKLGVCQEGK